MCSKNIKPRLSSSDSSLPRRSWSPSFINSALLLAAVLFSVLSFPCSASEEKQITETEIRAWAESKDRGTILAELIWHALNEERLNQLSKEQADKWRATEKALNQEIDNAKSSSMKAAEGFEKTLRNQTLSMTRIDRERKGWRTGLLSFLGGCIGGAAFGEKGALVGSGIGGAGGAVWWLLDGNPEGVAK